jgi:hypothetical protein
MRVSVHVIYTNALSLLCGCVSCSLYLRRVNSLRNMDPSMSLRL